MAAPPVNLPTLLKQLQTSIDSVAPHLPSEETLNTPKDGISLLDTKTELFISYLQNLVFLILVKLQKQRDIVSDDDDGRANSQSLDDAAVHKLAELRLYIEKGVRPLERKLQYQTDKVLRAADSAAAKPATPKNKRASKKRRGSSASESESDVTSDISSEEEEQIDDSAYRPNIAAFLPSAQDGEKKQQSKSEASDGKKAVYRPPKITPTSMPTTDSMNNTIDAKQRRDRSGRPLRSAAVDDYVMNEMGDAPVAQESIGATIARGGRGVKTDKEKRREDERRAYEESNFIRLPKESKKERSKRKREMGFASNELGLSSLGEMGDRVSRATKKSRR